MWFGTALATVIPHSRQNAGPFISEPHTSPGRRSGNASCRRVQKVFSFSALSAGQSTEDEVADARARLGPLLPIF